VSHRLKVSTPRKGPLTQLRDADHAQQHPAPSVQVATGNRGFSHDDHTPFPC
jgi:hypothetical protein